MPIHQTKLMMSKPQPTGMLTPHTPTPLNSSITMASSNPCSSENPTANPKNHDSGVFRRRTMSATFSVTVFSECPGATTGVSPWGTRGVECVSMAMSRNRVLAL
jgi:hypothetical protein